MYFLKFTLLVLNFVFQNISVLANSYKHRSKTLNSFNGVMITNILNILLHTLVFVFNVNIFEIHLFLEMKYLGKPSFTLNRQSFTFKNI